MNKVNELELLKYIHKFYPIGWNGDNNAYEGLKERGAIIEQKIKAVINEDITSWELFISYLKDHKLTNIKDLCFLQTPSYEANILIEDDTTDYVNYQKQIIVAVSLLCPYYTVFYQDTYRFLFSEEQDIVMPLLNNIYPIEEDNSVMRIIIDGLKRFFPEYNPVDYGFVLGRKIIGYDPAGYSNYTIGYPIYNFLFDDSLNLNNTNIHFRNTDNLPGFIATPPI